MLTRSSAGLEIAKAGTGTAGIKPGVGLGKEHCWLRSRAFFCMFLGRSRGILTILSALFIHIADTMLYVNLADNSALSLGSYPGHERDSAAEAQRLIKARQCALSPPTRLFYERGLIFSHPMAKVDIICPVALFIAPVCMCYASVFHDGLPL
jgi:hypothetical protein